MKETPGSCKRIRGQFGGRSPRSACNMKRPIYILDGMGPQAGGYLYNTLISIATRNGAKNNNDFPEIIIHSVPVPDFISNDKQRNIALSMLKERVRYADKLNVSCISIACNTAHILLNKLRKESSSYFISMIDEVTNNVANSKIKIVGIIATPSALRYKLYQKSLNKKGIRSVIPTIMQMRLLEKIIRNILQGKKNKSDERELVSIANSLKNKGAQAIILGCTELPLVFPQKYYLPIYNSVEILAQSLLQVSLNKNLPIGRARG